MTTQAYPHIHKIEKLLEKLANLVWDMDKEELEMLIKSKPDLAEYSDSQNIIKIAY